MKTKDEVEQLKVDWLQDPCWDIEDTPGFDEHCAELFVYRLSIEEEARRAVYDKKEELATELKTSFEVAAYILVLERRLGDMQRQIDVLFELS